MSFKKYLQKLQSPITPNYYLQAGNANPTSHKYEEIAKQGYEYNAYVRACVDLIANTAASLKPVLYSYDAEGNKTMVKDSELMDLLKYPNLDEGAFSFKQRMFSYALLADKCFIQKVGNRSSKQPKALNIMQPNGVKVIAGAMNPIGSFEVQTAGGKKQLGKDEVIYVKGFNPLDVADGSPTPFASGYAIDSNTEFMKFNLRNMQNGGVPPVVIKGARTEREVSQLRDMWEAKYAGSNNAGKPFFPMSDVEISTLGMNNHEAQWKEGIELTGKIIMLSYAVPFDVLLGASNRASYEQAYKSLYIQAVLPLWEAFLDAFNMSLTPLYASNGQKLMLEIDRNKIDALSEDKNELHKRVRQDYLAGLITRAEGREVIGYDPDASGETGDSFQQPLNVVFVNEDGTVGFEGEFEDVIGNNQEDAPPEPDDDAIADR